MTIIGGVGAPTQPRKEIPVERKWNWKHIAIAAIAVASILGLIAAISLFNTNPATTTTSSGWQPSPEPANPGGWIPPDEPNELATTPTPTQVTPITPVEKPSKYGWDINNLPNEIPVDVKLENKECFCLTVSKVKIDNSKITGTVKYTVPEGCMPYCSMFGKRGIILDSFEVRLLNKKGQIRYRGKMMGDPQYCLKWEGKHIKYSKYRNMIGVGVFIPVGEKAIFTMECPPEVKMSEIQYIDISVF